MTEPSHLIFEIPGLMPGFNEMENARGQKMRRRGSSQQNEYNLMKQRWSDTIGMLAIAASSGWHAKNYAHRDGRALIVTTFYETKRNRDFDNICAARKFIHDALIKAKVIDNDGWADIEPALFNFFEHDRANPHVKVEIYWSTSYKLTIGNRDD